ncbi:MAG TPA: hypothetical protein VF698_09955, partial [Thermoanaerobaculia bacterium]
MTAFVDRIPGASALIAAFRGDVAAEGETPAEPKYGGRFLANTILLAVVGTLVSLWFAVHVKPHVSVVLFGSVSLAGLAAGVAGIFWT